MSQTAVMCAVVKETFRKGIMLMKMLKNNYIILSQFQVGHKHKIKLHSQSNDGRHICCCFDQKTKNFQF